jgi:exopolysaccharide biosynthesis protein
VTAAREGRAADTGRNPRTVAAVRADGTVLLITIDGRQPDWSLGATLREAARTAKSLGAAHAVSLDSGGSTTMTVRGRVVNRPSDPGGERAVANGLFVLSS